MYAPEARKIIQGSYQWLHDNQWKYMSALKEAHRYSLQYADAFPFEAVAVCNGFIVGHALGIREERARRREKKPDGMIDTLYNSFLNVGYVGIKVSPRGRKAYRRTAEAVRQLYGNVDALAVAASEIEEAAYKHGFAAAMQLLKECSSLIDSGA